MATSPHSLGRVTTREKALSSIDGKSGCWGKSALERDVGISAVPTMISVDYDSYLAKHITPKQRPAYESADMLLLQAVQAVIYRRTTDLRNVFRKIAGRPQGRIGKPSDKIQRFSKEQFRGQLREWNIEHTPEQIDRVLGPYEDTPGEGLDYADFSDLVSLFTPDSASVRREQHQTQLVAATSKPISRTTASNILQTTTASVPTGKYGTYDGCVNLYGCGNGIDVNCDGTNNGFLPRDNAV
eukprot:TRINITY_DN10652_c0_g1_i1.p1 TRINITY_DN10652_c0_g1~~TRINITY_DN10652_c0_g1_i1.p1  ORF type:complete len:269 (+),score=50.26 TRINITY_DN10652_c0_g1_i1:86-808(+)